MSVTNVYHKSREHSITLNFSATENNLSWAFTAENDGEIFDVELNNVSSYTVAGAEITLPFTLGAGSSYVVSVIKIVSGQPASIVLNTRRAINKSNNVSVPDFGSYDGRFIFRLRSDNVVEKLDFNLLKASNYDSSGNWFQNPIVSEAPLPNISLVWDYIAWFIDRDGNEKVLATHSATTEMAIYVCIIDAATLFIEDLDGNINSASYIYHGTTAGAWSISGHAYDYINSRIVFRAGSSAILYDIATKSASVRYVSSSFSSMRQLLYLNRITSINPYTGSFLHHQTDYDFFSQRTYNYTPSTNTTTVAVFNRNDGYKYIAIPLSTRTLGELSAVNSFGTVVASYSVPGGQGRGGFLSYSSKYDYYVHVSSTVTAMEYAIRSTQSDLYVKRGVVDQVLSGDSYLGIPFLSGFNKNFICMGNQVKKRMYVFDIDLSVPFFGYLDSVNIIKSITINSYE